MLVVIGIIGLVIANYHQLVGVFRQAAVSIAASSSAIIAYFPTVAGLRLPIALGLLVLVAGVTWFGHWGRLVFAGMTLTFIAAAAASPRAISAPT